MPSMNVAETSSRPEMAASGPTVAHAAPIASVIVPCRGHAAELEACLRALVAQRVSWPYEVLVVDAGLDPEVGATVSRFPRVRLLRGEGALLPGAARNVGAAGARSDLLAFTDADCVPEAGWLEAVRRAVHDGARVVGGPVIDLNEVDPVASVDNTMQFIDFAPGRPDGAASHLPGCNVALRRIELEELGGFPEDEAVGEDTLLTEEAAARWPREVRFVSGMRVRHAGRGRLREFWRHQRAFGFARSRLALRLSSTERRLGRYWWGAGWLALKRLAYFHVRTAQWNRRRLMRLWILTPVVLLGLAAWSVGLRRGCRSTR